MGRIVPENPIIEESVRFFARLAAFDCECPYCGRLIQVGRGKPDNKRYDRLTSVVTCADRAGDETHATVRGCGRKFLLGIVAWPLRSGPTPERPGQPDSRPPDQVPTPHQLAEIRQYARGIWAKRVKGKGEPTNILEPITDMPQTGSPQPDGPSSSGTKEQL
jgi:hypothetical protein